ncbi:MAG: polysaccharide deacetylase family protein [Ruminococcus sp.]|nr:polysaccharide deacetylase family protein [Ruminococcus sp.]
MYRTYSVPRFFSLLVLDVFIFGICGVFFLVGRNFFTSAGNTAEESVKLPVMMYHSVYGDKPSEFVVTPEQLESDLSWLSSHGYKTVTAGQVIAYANGRGELPEMPVMITFDDGCYNNLVYLLPLLEKYDMTAVISVVGTYTDNEAVNDPHVPAYSYLTWDDIGLLAKSGRIELGNHTYDMHSLHSGRSGCGKLDGESEEDYRRALNEDIARLQRDFIEHTGEAPVVFAYPFGKVSRESIPVLRENGILMTLTCREKVNTVSRDPACLYGIDRFNRSGLYSTEEYMGKIFSFQ